MIYLKAAFLAVVEGITEFLPISSTGHLILAESFVELSGNAAFNKTFLIAIQLPAIFAVVLYFWSDLWPFRGEQAETKARLGLWGKIVVGVLPAACLGPFVSPLLDEYLLFPMPVAGALLVGGVIIVIVERFATKSARFESTADISLRTAFLIGLFQCLAMIPGTSRSGATIIGAMVLGVSRPAAAEFSFFLAIPTMVGATGLVLYEEGVSFSGEEWGVLGVGSLVSFGVAYGVIAWLMSFIRNHNFTGFGYYRIGVALLVFAFAYLGWIGTQ